MQWETRLRREKQLGVGAYGKAILVRDTAQRKDAPEERQKLVLKEIVTSKMSRKEKDAAKQEAKLLEAMQHPNIVRCRGHFQREAKLCILLDYCSHGDLESLLKSRRGQLLPQSTVLDYTSQIALGVKHMHDRRILHRDIKASNVFLCEDGTLKLGDLGISKVLTGSNDLARTAVGTPLYMAPECIQAKPYSFSSDMWSFGCVLYEMMSLKHAFNANDMNGLVNKIAKGRLMPAPQQYSKELRDLVTQLLAKDPSERPSMSDVVKTPLLKARIEGLGRTESQEEQQRMLSNNERDILQEELNRHKGDKKRIDENLNKIQEKREHRSANNQKPLYHAEQRAQQQRQSPYNPMVGHHGRARSPQRKPNGANVGAAQANGMYEQPSARPGQDVKGAGEGRPANRFHAQQNCRRQVSERQYNADRIKVGARGDQLPAGLNVQGPPQAMHNHRNGHAVQPGRRKNAQGLPQKAMREDDQEDHRRQKQQTPRYQHKRVSDDGADAIQVHRPEMHVHGGMQPNHGAGTPMQIADEANHELQQQQQKFPANAVEGVLAARQRRKEEEVRQREAQLMEARQRYFEEKRQAAQKNREQYESAIGLGEIQEQRGYAEPVLAAQPIQEQREEAKREYADRGQHEHDPNGEKENTCSEEDDGKNDEQLMEEMERLQHQRDAINNKIMHLQETLREGDCDDQHRRESEIGALEQQPQNKARTRISVLREVCQRNLGQELFGKLYTYLKERSRLIENEREVTDKGAFRNELRGKLGPEHFQFVGLIDRLLNEENALDNKVDGG